MRLRTRELALVVLVAAALTVVFTWPLARDFDRAGRIDSGDGRFSVWNVGWVARALSTNPWEVWDANIFYPHQSALAYSEANLVAGAVAVPMWLATENALAAANWAILCAFALAFVAMYVLVRRLGGSPAGAGLAAIGYAFSAFAFSHIPHIQLLMTFGLPLVLLALHRFVEAPAPRTAAWLGVALVVAALACGYYGIFAGLMTAFGALWFAAAAGRWRQWRYWTWLAGAAALVVVLLGPFYAPYAEVRSLGFQRSLEDARIYSVGWRAYFASPLIAHRWMLDLIGTWREVLFPGFLPLGFGAVAIAALLRRRGPALPVARAVAWFYVAVTALAVWASLGPDAGFYTALYHALPFMALIRAPARFGFLVTLALSVLGGLGFTMLERRLGRRARALFLLAVGAFALGRSFVGGLALEPMAAPATLYARLAVLPPGPVAEFPYFTHNMERHRHTIYMLYSTLHWKPLINGYSDFIPERAFADLPKLGAFPGGESWEVLREHQARYVVVHWHLYPPDEHTRVREAVQAHARYLRQIVSDGDTTLYEIVDWPDWTGRP